MQAQLRRGNPSLDQNWALAGQAASPQLRIWLLGEFRLLYGSVPVTSVNTPRLQALLAYLILHREAPQPRRHLAFLFWPDTTETQALTNLRNLLHKLRQALPDADRFFDADAHGVQWRPDAPCTVDVVEFDQVTASTAREDLSRAADLYRGDLLPSCYDDWIAPEREQRQRLAGQTLERLIELLAAAGDYKAAIGFGQRLRLLDPLNEATYQTIMRLHGGNLDRVGVMRTYHTCAQTLQAELGAAPSRATRELYEHLLAGAAAPAAPAHAAHNESRLVGRRAEWENLQAAYVSANSGNSMCVILTGEAGIGKTRLAEELLAWASHQNAGIAQARCYAAEGVLSFGPVVTWLRTPALYRRLLALPEAWVGEAARLIPELLAERPDLGRPAPLDDLSQRQRLFEALARAALGREDTLVLLIDDLQWCDRDTLEWLHFLLRFEARSRLLVLGTARSEDLQDNPALGKLLTALSRDSRLTEIPLGRLNREEAAALVAHMTEQTLSAEQLADLYRETEGNPLFLVETMRFGLASPHGPARHARTLAPGIRDLLSARLAQLSQQARTLAGDAAAIGREFTLPVLARVTDLDEAGLVRNLDELWQRRIVRDASDASGEAYDFTHDKLREVAYSELSPARRRLLHRSIAEAIEAVHCADRDAVAAQAAAHYERAGCIEQAAACYGRAAGAARRVFANADAIAYYRRALALSVGAGAAEGSVAGLYEGLADVLHLVSQREDARSAYRQALASLGTGDRFGAARIRCRIGRTFVVDHNLAEAEQAFDLAYAALGPEPLLSDIEWWREWLRIQHEQVASYYWSRQVDRIEPLMARARPFVEQYGTPPERAKFYRSLMMADTVRRRWQATDETLQYAQLYLAAQQEVDDPIGMAWAIFSVGLGLFFLGDLEHSEAQLRAALAETERVGNIALGARCLTYLTAIYRQRGQVEETDETARQTHVAASAAHLPEFAAMATANQAWVAWRRGEFEQAKALARAALTSWDQAPFDAMSPPFRWLALWPLLALATEDDDQAAAATYARALLDPSQQKLPEDLTAQLEAALRAWDAGRPDAARLALRETVTLAYRSRYL